MDIALEKSTLKAQDSVIEITGSKSESNRLLILQALFPEIEIKNLSNSDDSQVMQMALSTSDTSIDIHHAGTAMRFLTAYFAIQEGREIVLTGSSRMKERPIGVLVEALKDLGADITYLENEGYPPLKIYGKSITNQKVSLAANVSSQYISALLLIASKLKNGLELTLEGKMTSVPYIQMTLSLLNAIGIETSFSGNFIKVLPQDVSVSPKTLVVESDWSSVSYWYSILALSPVGTKLQLSSYKEASLQGDAVLVDIYKQFGVETSFLEHTIQLHKTSEIPLNTTIDLDLANAPDIAQTIAVSAFGLGLSCDMVGLHTLKIKETDRLQALKNELSKFGANVTITESEFHLKPANTIVPHVTVHTYNDHRMAMAFAPLALKTDLQIKDADVVSKSYPDFWTDLALVGVKFQEQL